MHLETIYGRYTDAVWNDAHTRRGYECGSKKSNEVLARTVNNSGLYDLSKVGCSFETFLASKEEIERVRRGEEVTFAIIDPPYRLDSNLVLALITLVFVNFLTGVYLLGKWIICGTMRRA